MNEDKIDVSFLEFSSSAKKIFGFVSLGRDKYVLVKFWNSTIQRKFRFFLHQFCTIQKAMRISLIKVYLGQRCDPLLVSDHGSYKGGHPSLNPGHGIHGSPQSEDTFVGR